MFSATDLSSTTFITSTANATTLNVSGTSTLNTLNVSGNSTFSGSLAVNGTTTLSGNIIPSTDVTYDLGSASKRFKSIYVGPGSLSVICDATECDTATEYKLSVNPLTNKLRIWDGTNTFFTVDTGGDTVAIGQLSATQAPTLAHNFSAWPTGTSNVADSSLLINPASATADSNLIGAAVNGTVKFLVDAEGDVYANNLILSGSTSTGATTIGGNLIVQDNTTLGDASTDTISFGGRVNSNLTFATDNIYDLGASGVTRPRTGYFGTSVVSPSFVGALTGNASTVTNATLTTALTVNTGTVSLIGDAANTSALTIGAGAVSVSGTNTGDNSVNTLYSGLATSKADVGQTFYIGTTQLAINRASAALTLAGLTLTTPDLGTPSAVVLTNASGTAANLTAGDVTGLDVTAGQTLTVTSGGTLGSAAYTASGAYATAAQGSTADAALPSASFTDAAVTGKLLTGFASGAGTVAATDTILQAINKLDGNVAGKAATGQTMYIGSTQVAINRASAALALTGITSIDGSSASLTTSRNIFGLPFNGTADIGSALGTGAYATISNYATLATPVFTSKITVGVASGSTGSIELLGTTSGVVTLKPADEAGTWTMTLPTAVGGAGTYLKDVAGNGVLSWAAAGTGTVTSASVVSANGFTGTVATETTTPAITLTTSVTGLLKGNGTAMSAATSGTDYSAGTNALSTGILKSTTTTGDLTIAVAGDFPTLNQNTSGNAATVTTNANLTGPITSIGNATSVAAQTGIGSTFVMNTSPTLVTPDIGVATATSVNKVALTAPATSSTLTIADGKTLTASSTFTLTGTDGKGIDVGAATSGKILIGDGSNMILSTASYPTTAGTTGNVLTSNGTDWLSSALSVKQLTQNFTAGEDLNAGDVVQYINNQVKKSGGNPGTNTYGTATGITGFQVVATISSAKLDATHFVVAYARSSGPGTAIIGTISGSTITYGTPVAFYSPSINNRVSVVALDSTHFVVAYQNGTTGSNDAIIGTVSDTIITYGTAYSFLSNTGNGPYYISVATLDSTHFVLAYDRYDSGGGTFYLTTRIGSVSGSTITYGTALDSYSYQPVSYVSVAALDSTHFVVAYVATTSYGRSLVGSVSGTTITYGTINTFFSAATMYVSVSALDSTHFVVAYVDNSGTSYGTAIVGSVSGTTITYGTAVTFSPSSTSYNSVSTLDSTHFVVSYRDGNPYGIAKVGSVSGTAITFGTANTFLSTTTASYTSVATLDSTHFIVAYADNTFLKSKIGVTDGATTISSYGTVNPILSSSVVMTYISAAKLDSTHFVVAYATTNGGIAVVGTVSGSTITYGTAVVFDSSLTSYISVATLDSTHFVIAYQDSSYVTAIVGSVSGTTITFGTAVVVESQAGYYVSVAALDSTHFVVTYQWYDGVNNYGRATIGVTNGATTISSYGSKYNFLETPTYYISVSALSSTKFVVAYYDETATYSRAIIGTISGTTITYGSPVTFLSAATTYISVAALDSTYFVIAYKGTGSYGNAIVGSVSGTTITYGTAVIFLSTNTTYISVAALDATHFVIAYRNDGTTTYGYIISGSILGTTITYGPAGTAFNSAATTYISIASLDSTTFVVASADATIGKSVIGSSTANAKFIGVVKTTTTSGNAAPVIISGVADSLTGLTPGAIYYTDASGNLSTTYSSYRAGLSISATELALGTSTSSADQFFGDMIFANNFRITEGINPESLVFKNQLWVDILTIDETGTLTTTKLKSDSLEIGGENKLYINSSGNLGIGVQSPSYQLQLSSDSAAKPVSNTWTVVSDSRLKKDILDFTDGLDIINQINPVSYVLNGKGGMPEGSKGIGIIAQDVKDIIPYTIATFKAKLNPEDLEDTELYSFNSSALTFVTINAIKELDLKVNNLSATEIGVPTTFGQLVSSFFSDVLTKVESGVAYMKGLVVNTLEIGTTETPSGITMYDKTTKEVYCLIIDNGEIIKTKGKCGVVESSSSSSSSSSSDSSSNTDTTPPVITLNGEAIINLKIEDTYTEEKATVTDNVDTEMAVVISGSVDTLKDGTYTITYNAKDTTGNSATEVKRTVVVGTGVTPTPPAETPPATPPEPTPAPIPTPTPEPTPEPVPIPMP